MTEPDRKPFEEVLAILEALYLRLERAHPGWGQRRTAWHQGRADTLAIHGWTEETFYAELDARRAGRNRGAHFRPGTGPEEPAVGSPEAKPPRVPSHTPGRQEPPEAGLVTPPPEPVIEERVDPQLNLF